MMRAISLVALCLLGCSTLPAKDETCGNGVIDRGESCDKTSDLCDHCRLRCPSHDDAECIAGAGAGYRCGADDICHAPSGVFQREETASSFAFPVGQGQIADLDGDRIGDVVGFSDINIDVRFGDLTSDFTRRTVVVPFARTNPAIRTFPAHIDPMTQQRVPQMSDILLPTADGIAGFTARGKELVAYPFANSPGQRGACVSFGGTADVVEAFSIDKRHVGFIARDKTSLDAKISMLDPVSGECLTAPLCGIRVTAPDPFNSGVRVDHYELEIPSATLPAKPLEASAMIAVTVPTTTQMLAAQTCVVRFVDDPNGSAAHFKYTQVTATPISSAWSPPVLARADAGQPPPPCPGLFVAGAAGGIQVYPPSSPTQPCGLSTTVQTIPSIAGLAAPTGRIPLVPAVAITESNGTVTPTGPDAIGIITGDQFGGSTEIYALEGFTTLVPLYHSPRPLNPLRSADLDGNGTIEGVGIVSSQGNGFGGQPDIDVLYRTPPPVNSFISYRIPTLSAPIHLEIGDFDGNSADDIAYVEHAGSEDRLMLAYGTADRPLDPVETAAFGNVATLQRVDVPDSLEPTGTVLDDLVIASIDPTGTPLLTMLHGNPQRSMLAYYDPRPQALGSELVGAVAGNFKPETPAQDLAMFESFTKDGSVRLWTASGQDSGQGLVDPADGLVAPDITNATCTDQPMCLQGSRMVTWHLANRDVIIAADPPVIPMTPAGLMNRQRHLFVIDPQSKDASGQLQLQISTVTIVATQILFSLWGADIDNTGGANLVMSLGSVAEIGSAMDDQVLDCQVDDTGMPTSCASLATEVPELAGWTCRGAEAGRVRAAGRLDPQATTTSTDMLVMCKHVGQSDGTLFRVVHDGISFHATAVLTDGAKSVPVSNFEFLAVGDVNGDSVDDVLGISFDKETTLPHVSVHTQCAADDLACIDSNNPDTLAQEAP